MISLQHFVAGYLPKLLYFINKIIGKKELNKHQKNDFYMKNNV